MGFWDFLNRTGQRSPALPGVAGGSSNVAYSWWSPRVEHLGAVEWEDRVAEQWGSQVRGMSAAQMWRSQPHLRTVVAFLARNIAQLGLHTFERVSETDRRRDRTSPIAQALASPGDGLTGFDLLFALVGDKALYDRAYLFPWLDDTGSWRMRRLPPSWVSVGKADPFAVKTYIVAVGDKSVEVPVERLVVLGGYSPTSITGCSPTVEALKETLAEQVEASKYRAQVFARGGRASAVLKRPKDAPWSDAARERFREDWYAKYTGDGPLAGGTPILEDGMTLEKIDFSAHDQQWVEGMKLAFTTVAAAFHVNPTMVGVLDNANYSNVREFRRMLYGDTLGPIIAEIEATLNTFALPMLGMDASRFYVEFNIGEKLQGSFEEQTAALQSSVGRPWMTADEARARLNMPALGGQAAELVTPLNVLIGGQASPNDSAPKAFLARQGRSVLSAKEWDSARWDAELAAELSPALGAKAAVRVARKFNEATRAAWADGDPEAFGEDRADTLAALLTGEGQA